MTKRELEQIRQQIEAKYRRKLEFAEAEYNQDLLAYERLARLMHENDDSHDKSDKHMPEVKIFVRSLSQAVQDVVPAIKGDFDINTVIANVLAKYPGIKTPINPTSISGILRTLEQNDTIKLVKRGKGKRPSIYRYNKQEMEAVNE